MSKTGKVQHMPEGKRFFFIRGDDNVEYFAHADSLLYDIRLDQVTVGDVCDFVPSDGRKGKGPRAEAIVIKRLEPSPQLLLDSLFKK